MVSEERKRKILLGGLFGAISGAILAAGLYYFTGTLVYVFLIPVAAVIGAAQMRTMAREDP